jgi:hypothetical protein
MLNYLYKMICAMKRNNQRTKFMYGESFEARKTVTKRVHQQIHYLSSNSIITFKMRLRKRCVHQFDSDIHLTY